jgi:hypothetical protein
LERRRGVLDKEERGRSQNARKVPFKSSYNAADVCWLSEWPNAFVGTVVSSVTKSNPASRSFIGFERYASRTAEYIVFASELVGTIYKVGILISFSVPPTHPIFFTLEN